MSPRRPISGVAIDALSRYAVRTQLTESTDVPSACWMSGSAGATSDWTSAYPTPATASSVNVTRMCVRAPAMQPRYREGDCMQAVLSADAPR